MRTCTFSFKKDISPVIIIVVAASVAESRRGEYKISFSYLNYGNS
jgi:hypothetical protein